MLACVSSAAGRSESGQTPFVLVGVLVLLPAALLVALGVRTLAQDARLVEAQARERLDRAAAHAAQDLERGLGLWDRALAEVGRGPLGPTGVLPRLIADVLDAGTDAVLVRLESGRREVLPAGRLLYALEPLSPVPVRTAQQSSALRAGEILEIQKQDYEGAAEAYRALIRSADPAVRLLALQRLARTEAKAGRREEALRLYQALERESGAMVGDLPADLVGSVQRCELIATSDKPAELVGAASAFYRSLAEGRWHLEKASYLYYSQRAREWLAGAAAAERQVIDNLAATEREKIRLSDAVGAIGGAVRSSGLRTGGHRVFMLDARQYLAFWRSASAGPDAILIVLGENSLRSYVWPRILRAAASDDVATSIVAPDGTILFATPEASATAGGPMLREQSFQDGDFLWRVRATPVRPDALYVDVARRRWLYLAMLVVMVGGLLAAGLVVGRSLRREVEVARLKGQFVAAVSHEFRSPLTGISQLSELLVGGKVTDETRRKEYYGLIHRESQRLSRLVEQVLDFARMDEGRKQYRFEAVDTNGWMRHVVEDFERTPSAQGRRITVSVPPSLPPLSVDAQAMAGAIHNLFDNAVKYSPNGGEVVLDVSATADGSGVAIAVRDEGVGIPPDEQQLLFERFFRGRQLADTVAGTGLGLSLVKQVVSAHGGEILLRSTPGVGTTFTVVLPVERAR